MKNIYKTLTFFIGIGLGSTVNASIVDITPTTSPVTVPVDGGSTTTMVTYALSPATMIKYGENADFNPQDPGHIKMVIETAFGITPISTVGACDGSGCTAGTTQEGNGDNAGALWSIHAFNVLAIHYGNNELVFYWADPQMYFGLSGLPRGISNFRTYSTSAVPVPVAFPLMSMLGALDSQSIRPGGKPECNRLDSPSGFSGFCDVRTYYQ